VSTNNAPIGIFDSGVGGLTVARAIIDQLPGESILYIGDTARGPYGPKSLAEVRSYALEIMDELVKAGVKAIVIACNTASAAMLRDARERYGLPVIEVIQPAVRRAVSATRSGKVGVIGTVATIESKAYLDVQSIAREVIKKIGYTKSEYMFESNSCGILSAIHEQSQDINQGVERKKKEDQGAGDQGMMFGYATNETNDYMPLALDIAHKLLIELAAIRRENKEIKYLRPDAKSQVTLEYDDNNKPVRIDAIVISTQHDDFDADQKMLAKIKADLIKVFS